MPPRKKKTEEKDAVSPDDFIGRIFEETNKEFGDGILIAGSELANENKTVIPISPSMDMMTNGGIVEGSWVGITGNEKLGKTTMALQIAANAQKPEYGSRPIFYGNVEGRISKMHLTGIRGLDLSPGKFNIIRSIQGRILTAQEHLAIYRNIIQTVPNAVLIIDSISCFCGSEEHDGGVGKETRGGGAKLFSQWCRLMNQVVPVNNNIVIGITHLICDTGNAMAGKQERAARMWKYQCDYQLKATHKEAWLAGNRQIGQKVFWVCNCSKLGPPGIKVESYLRYGTGIDGLFECIQYGLAAGVIKKAGAWLTLGFMQEHLDVLGAKEWNEETEKSVKFQGAENLYKFLIEKPDIAEVLRKEIMALTINSDSGDGEDNGD